METPAINPTVRPVSVAELQVRFGLRSPRCASAMIRRMKHVRQGKAIWTTEGWLAEWTAQQAAPSMGWPPKHPVYDPLEEAVVSRVLALVGRLAEEGKLKVVAT